MILGGKGGAQQSVEVKMVGVFFTRTGTGALASYEITIYYDSAKSYQDGILHCNVQPPFLSSLTFILPLVGYHLVDARINGFRPRGLHCLKMNLGTNLGGEKCKRNRVRKKLLKAWHESKLRPVRSRPACR